MRLTVAWVIALATACGGGSENGPTTTAPSPSSPAAPTGLTATATSPSSISLTWVRNSQNETGFQIERSNGGTGTFSLIATTAAGASSFVDAGLAASTMYNYRVRAIGSGGTSAYSNVASLTTPVACAAPTVITQSIFVATTWTAGAPGCVHYHVTGPFIVNAALTIQAGTVISFAAGAGLTVTSGNLSAVGTPAARIRFTGDQAVRGYWNGLNFSTGSAANELSYADVLFGGGDGSTNAANVSVNGIGQLRLTHDVVEQSAGVGIYFASTTTLSTFTADTLRNNANAGIRLPDELVGGLDNTSDYVDGNGVPYIDVYARQVSTAQTWQVTTAPIHFSGQTLVTAALSIVPGVTIQCGADASIAVITGSLSAVGTATNRIQFSADRQERGYWRGLAFESNSAANHLSFVNVSYAGGGGTSTDQANVEAVDNGQLRLDNVISEQSAGVGFFAGSTASLSGFSSNTFRNNADVGVRVPDELVGSLDTATEYASGNGAAYVDAYARQVSTGQTWRITAVPIRFSGQTLITAALTLVPGVTVLFRADANWYVISGSLNAVGTAASRIRFLGEQATPGYWRGLIFATNSAANELTYTEIAHGGDATSGRPANIDVSSSGTLKLTNSNVHDSAGWGLYVEQFGVATPTPLSSAGNVFTNNALGPSNVP